jgi:hypothetical protein
MPFGNLRNPVPAFVLLVFASLFGCGGGSSKSSSVTNSNPTTNTQAIVVNSGPASNYVNGLFTSVTVCAPGSSNCQSVSGVLVDTGSYGLRILSSALGTVNSSLPQQNDSSGNPVLECAQFADSVIWGPVKSADIQIGGEKANSLPIQVIDNTTVPVTASCSAHHVPEEDLKSLGANGILGIGYFIDDCGPGCTGTTNNMGFYYGCAGSSCQVIAESAAQQVQNPVALFSTDNNGVIVDLPAASGNTPTVSGSLIFGIGTQSNNSLDSAQVYSLDSSGNIKTILKSTSYSAFIDSGSNGYFFLDQNTTGITACPTSSANGFYCPSSPVNLSVTNSAGTPGGASGQVNFTVGNASTLFQTGDSVLPTLGGPNAGVFDWGLPFFYGRKVYTAIEGRATPGGTGPYWAY